MGSPILPNWLLCRSDWQADFFSSGCGSRDFECSLRATAFQVSGDRDRCVDPSRSFCCSIHVNVFKRVSVCVCVASSNVIQIAIFFSTKQPMIQLVAYRLIVPARQVVLANHHQALLLLPAEVHEKVLLRLSLLVVGAKTRHRRGRTLAAAVEQSGHKRLR